jgi:hypothetical protein
MSLVSFLYRLARTANDVKTVSSGNPKKIVKRMANKAIGRKVVRRLWWK